MTAVAAAAWARQNLFRNRRDTATTVVAARRRRLGRCSRSVRFVVVTGRWEVVRANLTLLPRRALPGRRPVAGRRRRGRRSPSSAGLVTGVLTTRRRAAAIADGAPLPPVPFGRRLRNIAARYWPALALLLVLLLLGPHRDAVARRRRHHRRRRRRPARRRRAAAGVGPVAVRAAAGPAVRGRCRSSPAPLGWDDWGGLMLTLLLASVSMIACFPLGVLLALGRRSTLPAIRAVSIGVSSSSAACRSSSSCS